MTLAESIGVIMGANLGTTITAWIIAYVGKFSIAKIALPVIGAGIPFFFAGRGRWKAFGEFLVGFGLLFYGLGLLKDAVPDVKGLLASTDPLIVSKTESVRAFIENLGGHGIFSVFIFLCIGILLTVVVQSSSAAMAISITLAFNGWIGWHESAAIVMGENIGTTVTAWLAALGASVNAKRAARAHLIFNVFGVCWMLVLFYPFTSMVEMISGRYFEALATDKQNTELAFRLAIFHTLFNFTNILLLVGFAPKIANLVTRWIKEPAAGAKRNLGTGSTFVSESMVESGTLTIPQGRLLLSDLSTATKETVEVALGHLSEPESAARDLPRIEALELTTDELMTRAQKQLSRAARGRLSPSDALLASAMARAASEFEEVADHAVRVVQRLYEGARPDAESLASIVTPLKATLEAAYTIASGGKPDGSSKAIAEGGPIHAGVKNIALHHHLARMAAHARHVVKALTPPENSKWSDPD
jgi:phosphate:Na+ symporter